MSNGSINDVEQEPASMRQDKAFPAGWAGTLDFYIRSSIR